MLHYNLELITNRMVKDDAFVERLADGIASVGDELKLKYGLKMIFVPIPNKYTLYGYDYGRFRYNVSGERYDDFLPRLYKALDARGVTYIDLYTPYKARPDLMYDPSHGHWNDEAKKIFISRLYEVYEKEERLRSMEGGMPGAGPLRTSPKQKPGYETGAF